MKKLLISLLFILILLPSINYAFMEINCPNAVLIDASNGRVLYEKEAYSQAFPASTTKIMTALLALEKTSLEEPVKASATAINSVPSDGSSAYIQVGETFAVEDLLKCLLLVSGNDAANVLAEHIGGSIGNFVTMMNEKAKEIGCKGTHFVNANGLDDDNHYTTAYDLSIMYMYAYNNYPDFERILKLSSFSLPATDIYKKDDRVFTNTNRLFFEKESSDGHSYYYPYCTGGKTGYTSKAKNCFVASASKNDIDLIVCVLGGDKNTDNSSQRYNDTITLFNYGFERLVKKELVHSGDYINSVPVKNSKKSKEKLEIVTSKPLITNVDSFFNIDNLKTTINIDEEIEAPIEVGQKVGTAVYSLYDEDYTIDLVARNKIERKPDITFFGVLSAILVFLLRAAVVVGIIILIGRFYNKVLYKKKRKTRAHNVRRYNARFHK